MKKLLLPLAGALLIISGLSGCQSTELVSGLPTPSVVTESTAADSSGEPGATSENSEADGQIQSTEQSVTVESPAEDSGTPEQRAALVAREDVKGFLQRVRELKAQSRDVKGAELGVPDVLLGVLRDTTERYSKLLKYITIRPLKGKARQNVACAVPEAFWSVMVATLNVLFL